MENNVTSLETSKKLKAAGFPQTTHLRWYVPSTSKGEIQLQRSHGAWHDWTFAAPTSQDMADQLPREYNDGVLDLGINTITGAWIACYQNENGSIAEPQLGDTMAEALASLWLKLQEEMNSGM